MKIIALIFFQAIFCATISNDSSSTNPLKIQTSQPLSNQPIIKNDQAKVSTKILIDASPVLMQTPQSASIQTDLKNEQVIPSTKILTDSTITPIKDNSKPILSPIQKTDQISLNTKIESDIAPVLQTKLSSDVAKKEAQPISMNVNSSDQKPIFNTAFLNPIIEDHKETLTNEKKDEINTDFVCNQRLLKIYGLQGNSAATVEPHKFCPAIKRNCCSITDQNISMEYWNTWNQFMVDKYYESYIMMTNFILGYAQEGLSLSKEFETGSEKCKKASAAFEKLNSENEMIRQVRDAIQQKVRTLATLRSGFYCHLCDQHSQLFFQGENNQFVKGNVTISRNACRRLVRGTITGTYYDMNFIKPLVEIMSTLIGCKLNDDVDLVYEVNENKEKEVADCFFSSTGKSVKACEDYCSHLKFTKPDDGIDGSLTQLYKFYNRFYLAREKVFKYPEMNVMVTSMSFEIAAVRANMINLSKNSNFYDTVGAEFDNLGNFNTRVRKIGMKTWQVMSNRKYISYLTSGILQSFFMLGFALVMLI